MAAGLGGVSCLLTMSPPRPTGMFVIPDWGRWTAEEEEGAVRSPDGCQSSWCCWHRGPFPPFSVLLEPLREQEWKVLISLSWIFFTGEEKEACWKIWNCVNVVWEPVSSPFHSCSFYNILFLKINSFQVLMSALSSSFSAAWTVGTFCTKTFVFQLKRELSFGTFVRERAILWLIFQNSTRQPDGFWWFCSVSRNYQAHLRLLSARYSRENTVFRLLQNRPRPHEGAVVPKDSCNVRTF